MKYSEIPFGVNSRHSYKMILHVEEHIFNDVYHHDIVLNDEYDLWLKLDISTRHDGCIYMFGTSLAKILWLDYENHIDKSLNCRLNYEQLLAALIKINPSDRKYSLDPIHQLHGYIKNIKS